MAVRKKIILVNRYQDTNDITSQEIFIFTHKLLGLAKFGLGVEEGKYLGNVITTEQLIQCSTD
jgi:hypothetical protein